MIIILWLIITPTRLILPIRCLGVDQYTTAITQLSHSAHIWVQVVSLAQWDALEMLGPCCTDAPHSVSVMTGVMEGTSISTMLLEFPTLNLGE